MCVCVSAFCLLAGEVTFNFALHNIYTQKSERACVCVCLLACPFFYPIKRSRVLERLLFMCFSSAYLLIKMIKEKYQKQSSKNNNKNSNNNKQSLMMPVEISKTKALQCDSLAFGRTCVGWLRAGGIRLHFDGFAKR